MEPRICWSFYQQQYGDNNTDSNNKFHSQQLDNNQRKKIEEIHQIPISYFSNAVPYILLK